MKYVADKMILAIELSSTIILFRNSLWNFDSFYSPKRDLIDLCFKNMIQTMS